MNAKQRPPHRTQSEAPGRKAPAKITEPRTIRISPDAWQYAIHYAIQLSSERGYVVSIKEALDVIIADHKARNSQTR